MGRLLFLLFFAVPLIEIAIFIAIGQWIGILPTLLGVLATALIGAVLVRAQGLSLLAEIRATMAKGQLPAKALGNAMMVGIAGVLLMTPGYFTDSMGLLLLIPQVRELIYRQIGARMRVNVQKGRPPPERPDVLDLDGDDWRPR